MRVSKLSYLFDEDIDAILITDAFNMNYFVGFTGGTGYILVLRDKVYVLTDSRYTEQARRECKDAEVIDEAPLGYVACLNELCSKHDVKYLAFEDEHVSYLQYEKIDGLDVELVELGDELDLKRSIKESQEIDCIKRAESIGDYAFSYILTYIKNNNSFTEMDIAAELEYYMKKHGARALSFDTIVASGTNSSMPHALVSNKIIEPGDFITMDFGCIYEDYCSDMTRTIAYKSIDAEKQKIYSIVLQAQMSALEAIRPGVKCSEIDRIARDIIRDAGYGDYFGHGLGHSVGLFIHEEPRFSPRCDTILEPGMVITVEPGIYLPGKFGVRIEDLVCVTKEGYVNLTSSNKDLVIVD